MTTVGKKIYYLEALRALAALTVVMLHLVSVNWYGYIGSFNWIVFTVIAGAARFCVPVFFMISGVLFLQKEKERTIKKIYTKNIFRMVLFLVFWAFVYQIYQLLKGQAEGNILWMAVKNISKGDVSVHLWFVYAIIGIYLLVPVLKVFVDHADQKQLLYAILILFTITSIIPVLRRFSWVGMQVITVNFDKLGISGLGSYVGYFLLGHYLHTYDISKKGRGTIYVLGLLGAAFTILVTLYRCMMTNTCDETYFSYVMPNVALWSVAIFVFFKQVCEKQSNLGEGKLAGVIQYLAGISLGIYGIHLLVIFVLQDLGLSTLAFNALLSVPLLYILVVAISVAVVSLLKKVPLIRDYVC